MEMPGSIAEARRCSSSTSGWSWLVETTRAITRRCSVMRMPFSTQSFSIRSIVSSNAASNTPSRRALSTGDNSHDRARQRAAHDNGVNRAALAAVIGMAAAGLLVAELGVKRARGGVGFGHFEMHGRGAAHQGGDAGGGDE